MRKAKEKNADKDEKQEVIQSLKERTHLEERNEVERKRTLRTLLLEKQNIYKLILRSIGGLNHYKEIIRTKMATNLKKKKTSKKIIEKQVGDVESESCVHTHISKTTHPEECIKKKNH